MLEAIEFRAQAVGGLAPAPEQLPVTLLEFAFRIGLSRDQAYRLIDSRRNRSDCFVLNEPRNPRSCRNMYTDSAGILGRPSSSLRA